MRTFLLVMLALLLSAHTMAQQRPKLGIVIEELDSDAAACGISKSSLESIAALTLRNNGIQTVNEITNPYLYVRAVFLTIQAGGDSCVFSMRVEVRGIRQLDMPNTPLGAFTAREGSHTLLCVAGGLNISPTPLAVSEMTRELEEGIKLCLGRLDY